MALGTLETFAAYRGVDYDPTDVQALLAVENATQMVRTYCDQVLDLTMDDEVALSGSGTLALLLPEMPVLDVTVVTLIGADGTETELAEDTDWVLDQPKGTLYRTSQWENWPRGRANIHVTYDHGYETYPADLMGVIMSIATRGIASSTGQEVTLEQIGTYQVQYNRRANDIGGLEDAERMVLTGYRRTLAA